MSRLIAAVRMNTSMPSTPLIVVLAKIHITGTLSIPRRVSMVAYLYLLAKVSNPTAYHEMLKACILWLANQPRPLVRQLLKLLERMMYGKKKALLIGILQGPRAIKKMGKKKPKAKSKKAKVAPPEAQRPSRGPHHDVNSMQVLLIDKYRYNPDDIVVLIDDGDPTHPQPTRANILSQIKNLVKDIQDGDKLFFYYTGCSGQEDTAEEDGKDEFIPTSDGSSIMDDELKTEIVDPLLNVKCTLTAVLDCSHSGSLLDLPHTHCNDVYVPWLKSGRRRTKTLWAERVRSPAMYLPPKAVSDSAPITLNSPTSITPHKDHRKPTGLVINTSFYPTPQSSQLSFDEISATGITGASPVDDDYELPMYVSPARYMNSPVALYYDACTGMCRDEFLGAEAAHTGVEVICISATEGNELAWEDGEGASMTHYLVQNLYTKSKPTLHSLMTSLSHDIYSYYINDFLPKMRVYKKWSNVRSRRQQSVLFEEMYNSQNPTLSSLLPLNMEQIFDP